MGLTMNGGGSTLMLGGANTYSNSTIISVGTLALSGSGSIANSTNTHTATGANNPNVAVSGTGALAPSVTTQAANPTNTTSATLNGTVTANNGATITDRGFYWKTSPGVTTSDNQVDEGGTTTGTFSKAITPGTLNPNHIYYYRAYAVNSIGTTLDSSADETNFYTLANTPTAPTVNGATTSSLNVAIGGSDGNPSSTAYAIKATSSGDARSGDYVQLDGALGSSPVYQTSNTWGTVTVSGLNSGTYYAFQAAATNAVGIATAFGPATTVGTPALAFTPGNLVVERVGNGTETYSAESMTIFMDEFTTGGSVVQSIEIPDSGSSALIDGDAASDGGMTRSPDGTLLCFPGYNTNLTYGSSLANSTTIARGIGKLDVTGNYTLVATSAYAHLGNNIRGAAGDGNTNYWSCGTAATASSGGGINYLGLGPTNSVYAANLRDVYVFGTNLWYDTGSSTPGYGIWEFTSGTPTTNVGNTATKVINLSSSDSPYNFSVNSNATVIYYADDGSGIHKWTNNGSGTWSLAHIVNSTAVYGLTVDWSTTPATIYATTGSGAAANSLIEVVDNGAGSSATTLTTAAANTSFRNVAFAPVKATTAFSGLAANQSVPYGTGSVVLSGKVNAPYSKYPADGEIITVTINGNAQNTTVNDSTGDFSINFNLSGIPPSPYTITYSYAGDTLLSSASDTSKTLTVVGPPTANPATYFRASGTALKISITNLLTQYASASAGDPPGLVSADGAPLTDGTVIATTTNGSSLYYTSSYNGSAYLILTPTNNLDESFQYVVNDTIFPPLTATNLINVVVTNAVGQVTGNIILNQVDNTITTMWAGVVGDNYIVQRNTNLVSGAGWVDIWTTNNVPGVFSFTDTFTDLDNTAPQQAYYRLRSN
ncbi:MAG TPA: hypothetical protein VMD27_11120 [Candidatus Aquilonibacter sp.]|nr:hypothetical protein [Candidatus Aquilonibacter sp.]